MKLLPALFLSLVLVSDLLACQVPVFRYALERWPADDFRLLVTSHGPLDDALQADLDKLQKSLQIDPRPVNLSLELIDLAALSETDRLSMPGLDHARPEPTMILLPPGNWLTGDPAWIGPASRQNLNRLLDSPARRQCTNHLLKGESAVWIVVESGDPEKDQRAHDLLSAGLKRASSELEIPAGVIHREDLENRNFESLDLDDVLRSSVPLKISWTVLPISRDDEDEAIFLRTLVRPAALRSHEALIVPVFGRGRAAGALAASRVTEKHVFDACKYLCGACSCQAKQGNPGYDLLFKTNWDDHLDPTVITADSELVQQALDVVTFNPGDTSANKNDSAAPPPSSPGGSLPVTAALVALAAVLMASTAFMALSRPAVTDP